LQQTTPIIIGANGWLSRAADYLISGNPAFTKPIIFGSGHSVYNCNGKMVYPLQNAEDFLSKHPIEGSAVVLNFAYLTMEKASIKNHKDYIDRTLQLNKMISGLIDSVDPEALLFISSGAATFVERKIETSTEMYIYGKQKLIDEEFYSEICEQKNIKILIPRVYNIGGPFINKMRLYALSDFILQVLETKRIKINAQGKVYRSYCHIYDLLSTLLSELVSTRKLPIDPIFEVGGDEIVEMYDLAKYVMFALGVEPKEIMRPFFDPSLEPNNYYSDNTQFTKLANINQINKTPLINTIHDTIRYIKDEKSKLA